MINIPVYRAKKKDKEEYVIGWLYCGKYIFPQHSGLGACIGLIRADLPWFEIDTTTLAIHFPDMLANDSNKVLSNGEKELRIFASLSEDGKGGDILKTRGNEAPCKFNRGFVIETIIGDYTLYMLLDKVKILGIQE